MFCICIPARLQSTRIPNKLLLPLHGKPVIQHTVEQCLKVTPHVYVFTDSHLLSHTLEDYPVTCILTKECRNGTERLSKYLQFIPYYKYIVNVQADEPFISPKNIQHAIQKHTDNVFYTTLHQVSNDFSYIRSTSSVKVVVNKNNHVMYYSRSVIPANKKEHVHDTYNLFTGIYVFHYDTLKKYHELKDTPLQLEEDVEQLKILEHGYTIASYPTIEYNEISLNTQEDYEYLKSKYETSSPNE